MLRIVANQTCSYLNLMHSDIPAINVVGLKEISWVRHTVYWNYLPVYPRSPNKTALKFPQLPFWKEWVLRHSSGFSKFCSRSPLGMSLLVERRYRWDTVYTSVPPPDPEQLEGRVWVWFISRWLAAVLAPTLGGAHLEFAHYEAIPWVSVAD